MNVIARSRLTGYWKKYRDSKSQLEAWYQEADKASWDGPQDVKRRYPSASILHDNVVVFNIKGNKYRLVVKIQYESRMVLVKWFGTHADYDKQVF
ncbi:MAG: type II toxin-antitoxin system HigB family toxin [Nitrospirae bacterium]|nr:type II toxin-antitoxin system HigB family toxin [Nitrospirota bacterium]